MKVLVCGTGTMGKGITQVFAQSGHEVFVCDPISDHTLGVLPDLDKIFEKLVVKGKLSKDTKYIYMNRIQVIQTLDQAHDVDFAIEVISEDMQIKKGLFGELDRVLDKKAIFASNTSLLSITELALSTKRPDRFAGMHFFNPAPVMELVEVIDGITTSPETVVLFGIFQKNWVKNLYWLKKHLAL